MGVVRIFTELGFVLTETDPDIHVEPPLSDWLETEKLRDDDMEDFNETPPKKKRKQKKTRVPNFLDMEQFNADEVEGMAEHNEEYSVNIAAGAPGVSGAVGAMGLKT